ncbi:MAG: hypothetical protein Tsb0020_25490 [Haliangiales bacterium]
MFDWLGSIKLHERSSTRVVLSLARGTRLVGWALVVGSLPLIYVAWSLATWLLLVPGLIAALGLMLATLQRVFVFDREAGVLEIEQGVLGWRQRATIPLFHLRAVVIVARERRGLIASLFAPGGYLAYLDRRVGEAIYLDESRRCAALLPMAEAIAELAELRLEYDAMSRVAGDH